MESADPPPNREAEASYRTIVHTVPTAIMVLDVDSGRFIEGNADALALLGLTRDELLATGPGGISPSSQPDGRPSAELAAAYVRAALEGGRPHFEWLHRHASGRLIPCEVRLVRLPADGRRLVCGTVSDIPARRDFERRFRRSQERRRVGRPAFQGRVLLAEDDPLVAKLIRTTLESSGLEVDHLADGAAALARFLGEPERYACLLLDHDLPRLTGTECLRRIRDAGHVTAALVLSGDHDVDVSDLGNGVALLRKPFSLGTLYESISAALASC